MLHIVLGFKTRSTDNDDEERKFTVCEFSIVPLFIHYVNRNKVHKK